MEAIETIRVQLEHIRDSIGETPMKYRHAAVVALKELAVIEARLAVLWKVEEMIPKQFFDLIVSPLRDGGFNVSLYNWDAEVEERECEGKTLIEAFTALVDAPAVEAKGGE